MQVTDSMHCLGLQSLGLRLTLYLISFSRMTGVVKLQVGIGVNKWRKYFCKHFHILYMITLVISHFRIYTRP